MKAAFQGVHGANSEVAAMIMFGKSITTVPCPRFEDVFDAVGKGKADYGIIPIENSLAGSIHQNYDLLLTHPLHIVGESHLPNRPCADGDSGRIAEEAPSRAIASTGTRPVQQVFPATSAD